MSSARLTLKRYSTRTRAFFRTSTGRRLIRLLKYGFHAALVGVIVYQLYTIDPLEVLKSVPGNPLFYLIFLVMYFSLPLTEYLIYRRFAPIGFIDSQWVFHRKRVYNKFFIGYSGELYLYKWLNERFQRTSAEVFAYVRDNNTLSIIASWICVSAIAIWLLATDQTGLVSEMQHEIRLFLGLVFGGLALFVVAATMFRQKIYTFSKADSVYIFGVHALRTFALAVLQVVQWYIIIPTAGFYLLFNFVAVQMVIGKIPFIPNKDLIFISLSIYLGQYAGLPLETFTSLLILNLLMDKLLGLASLFFHKR